MLIHVTGAKGNLGMHLTSALARLGDVRGSDVGDMDVTDLQGVMQTLMETPPDVVVHAAALKGNRPSCERPVDFFNVNTLGTLNLLEACRQLEVRKFILISSLTVHGPSDDPVDEMSPYFPLHPYAGSKGAAEAMVHSYANAFGIQAVVFRPNFIVGPIVYPQPYVDNIIYDWIEAIHSTGVIELAGDGQYEREWLHPRDVAAAIAHAVSSREGGYEAYILSGHRVTMEELAKRVIEQVGSGRAVTNPEIKGFSLISSDEKARRQLGWEPEVGLDKLIEEIWDEYRARVGAASSRHNRD